MKKLTALLLALSMTLPLAACGSKNPSGSASSGSVSNSSVSNKTADGAFDQNVEINIALHTADGIHDEAIKLFKTKIEEASGGAITVNVYENGTLGTEAENVTQLSTGEIECAVLSTLYSGNILGEWDATAIPFLFKSMEDVEAFWYKYWDEMQELSIATSNIRMIDLLTRGSRCLSADYEISDPAQLKGFKVRLPETTAWLTVWKSLGANCTAINWNETFTALQNGVVDGQENPAATAYNANIQEVNSYMMKTNHVYQYFYWCFNEDFWQGLPQNYRDLIQSTADECSEYCAQIAEEKTAYFEQELAAGGMTIVDVDFDLWQKAAIPGIQAAAESLNDTAKEYVYSLLKD
ncbi:MAG: TRAP transporter substrate-binding protein [Lawsonibacter sp.]